jgi:hypothetical protein
MADLEDRHADAGQRYQVALNLFENRQRQHRWTSGEVEDAVNGGHSSSCDSHENTKTRNEPKQFFSCFRAFVAKSVRL